MNFLQLKKVNNDISKPLNQLMREKLANDTDTRRYFYSDCVWNANTRSYDNAGSGNETRQYIIPINGYYTIRAYADYTGSYSKVVGKFSKGEKITMKFVNTYAQSSWRIIGVDITSNKKSVSTFKVQLDHDANITATGVNFISALAIGGAGNREIPNQLEGGNAIVRCNNGIAVGGGGSSNFATSYVTDGLKGYNGGSAYAWGSNVYAIGGGGGAGVLSTNDNRGKGGNAYINGTAVTANYNESKMANAIYSCRGNDATSVGTIRGGNGGCGGAGFNSGSSLAYCGNGIWGDGGNTIGGSSKGGDDSNFDVGGYGYFAGGNGEYGGTGGFYGGSSWNWLQNGGNGNYGYGGNGNCGGYGQLMGGSGNYGGNGLKAGTGSISNGTAIRHKSIVHTLPAFNRYGSSVVIIEYGISQDNY